MKTTLDRSAEVRARYDRIAPRYDSWELPLESLLVRRWRRLLWSGAEGERVLEVGVGTGRNFPFYPSGLSLVAVDLSGKMLERARLRRGRERLDVDLSLMDAQFLAFRDRSFDCVVASFVFCSVPDPVQGLREVARVLKPGGKAIFLEHMRSESLLGRLMDVLNPLVVRFSGANMNRKTVQNIEKAGLVVVGVENLLWDVVRLVVARAAKNP